MKIKTYFIIAGKKYKLTLLGKFAFLFFGIFSALLIGELMVRVFLPFPLQKEYMIFMCSNYQRIDRNRLDKALLWSPFFEFYGREYSLNKNSDLLRILCMGDSVTQGFHGKYGPMQIAETYPYKLEKLLQKYFNTKAIEVINAGQGGYSSYQGLRYLNSLTKYKPDLVISWFGTNDSSDAFFYEDKEQKIANKDMPKIQSILGHSSLYLLLKNYPMLIKMSLFGKPRVSAEDYYKNCEKMLKIARKNNFKIVFIAPFLVNRKNNSWYYLELYRKALLDLKQKYDCKVLDIPPYLPKEDLNKLFSDSCHPTNVGNASIANIIYEQLNEKIMLLIGN